MNSQTFFLFSAAYAGDRNDGGDKGDSSDNRKSQSNDNGGGDRGDSRTESGDSGQKNGGPDTPASPVRSSSITESPSGSGGTSIGYDPARNTLHLRLKLGSQDRLEPHSSKGLNGAGAGHGENEHQKLFSAIRVHPQGDESWEHAKSLELLERAVNSTEDRYRRALVASSPKGTSVKFKNKLGIGGLSFSPFEVLGVNLDSTSIARAEALGFTAEAPPKESSDGPHIVRLIAPPELDSVAARELLSRELPGHRFELNKIYRLYRAAMREDDGASRKGDPASPGQVCPPNKCYAREAIQWQEQLSGCARGLRIGVIDTEIDIGHPAFRGRHIHRYKSPDNRPPASDWHGTGVLSLLAGNPSSGTPGLVPDAEFFTAAIFYAEESGAMATDTISLLSALAWMQENDVKLINMSFSGPSDELVRDQLAELSAHGVVLVAAAGNEGPRAEPAYPAAYPEVIAVTAVSKDLRNYRYANRGEHIDVSAPGVDIWSAVPGAREGYHTGTSFAAPHVTGIIAVMPRDSLTGKKDELLDTIPVVDLGDTGRDPVYGRGLLVAPSFCAPPSDTLASAEPSPAGSAR